ncbi:MAG: PilZ domain-containing protein, partial [Gammaproteobacteria bacterium]
KRLDVDCEVTINVINSDQFYKASCVTLSGSGIALVSDQDFSENEELEVNIVPSSEFTQEMHFFIRIVHKSFQLDGGYQYGATILFDKNQE